MLYSELAIVSIIVALAIFIPHVITFLILRKLGKSPFKSLSNYEIILVSIVIGEAAIIIPTSTLGFISSIPISLLLIGIMVVSFSVAAFFLITYLRTKNRLPNIFGKTSGQVNDSIIVSTSTADTDIAHGMQDNISRSIPKGIFQQVIKKPEFVFIMALLVFYSYLVLIIPIDLSYDSANYYLPYSEGLLRNGFLPLDPFQSYVVLGAQPSFPPGISAIYAYSLNIVPSTDAFKLLPILFTIHLALSTALLAKEIYPKIHRSWIFIITLVSPPLFFFLTTAPYNPDLLFSAFFISSLLYIVKAKKSTNILWSVLAGISGCGMILTKDAGLLFLLPIFSLVLLGNKRIGRLWIIPFALQLAVPISFLLNDDLSEFYVQHSTALILVQGVGIAILLYISRSFQIKYNVRLLPFLSMFIPAIVFLLITTSIWGSPIIRTYAGLFTESQMEVDYPWATNIALQELGILAFPIQPQSFSDIFFSVGYVFIAPALGGLLLIPRIAGVLKIARSRDNLVLPLILFIIIVINWISVFGGFDYDDHSTFRRTLDVVAMSAVIAGIGMIAMIGDHHIASRLQFLLVIAIIFAIYLLTYFDYDSSLFSLRSRVIADEPLPQYVLYSVAIFGSILSLNKINFGVLERYTPHLLRIAIGAIFIVAISPYFANTAQILTANNGLYEETNRDSLSTLSFGRNALAVQQYFNERPIDGRILSYGVDWLSYRTEYEVLEMRTIISLAILKNYLTGDNTSDVVDKLKDVDVKYIVVPISGPGADRLRSLYEETRIFEVITEDYTVLEARFGNLAIYSIK